MNWVNREARRVRVKSIILSGHRKRTSQWNEWLGWEGMKSFVPALLLIPIDQFVYAFPRAILAGLLAACFARFLFVLIHAGTVALRLNERRGAFLKASGYDLTAYSLLADKEAWKVSLSGGTLHDLLKTRRPPTKVG
jgi:hypothetical protein